MRTRKPILRVAINCVALAIGCLATIAFAGLARATTAAPTTAAPSAVSSNAAGHGANTTGPYDATSSGGSAGNGNGNGQAVGKPCAGCVGSADNKNPPGQLPNGSDRNAGYECDRNHGIGRQNPAHTGCLVSGSGTSSESGTSSASVSTSMSSSMSSSLSTSMSNSMSNSLSGTSTAASSGSVAGAASSSFGVSAVATGRAGVGASRPLASTGAHAGQLTAVAFALVAAGSGLVLLGRRRSAPAHR